MTAQLTLDDRDRALAIYSGDISLAELARIAHASQQQEAAA